MLERLNRPVSKTGEGVTLPRVRISPPPHLKAAMVFIAAWHSHYASIMRNRFFSILGLIFLLLSIGLSQSTKDQLLNLARSGAFDRMSASEIRGKLKELGISESDAIQMAREKGYDLSRYLGTSMIAPNDTTNGRLGIPQTQIQINPTPAPVVTPATQPAAIETVKSLLPDTGKVPHGINGLEYFGYEIFKNIPTAFQPNEVGPVDPGYLIGQGDNLRLSIWGQTEFQYILEVDKEGRIFIPNVGQVMVAGTPLKGLQDKLKNQLSKYYAGLASRPPTVFLDVTVDKLRPLRVFVMGQVKQPGGYTISTYATVFNALYAVGGPLVDGSLRNIKVMRDNRLVTTVDLYDYILKGDQTSDVRLQNNDIIFVSPRGKTVSIRGEVLRQAIYELKENEGVKALVSFAGNLKSTAYLERAQIERVKPFEERSSGVEGREVVDINLADVLKRGKADIKLFDADNVVVFPVIDDMKNFVTIDGPVWRPGTFQIAQAPTLKKLIALADGLQPKIYFPVGHIIRTNADLITRRVIPFSLGKVMDGSVDDISLEPRDTVLLYSTEVVEVKDRYVNIFGEVKRPGRYPMRDNMTLADLILMAGGYNQEAYLLEAEVSRINPAGLKGDSLTDILHPLLPREFQKIVAERNTDANSERTISTSDFKLQHRDEVLVTTNPDYKEQQNVKIFGDVKFPGVYAIQRRGERLSELLKRAGGPTTSSYFGGAELDRRGQRLLVDFNEAFYKNNKLHDVMMQAGDSITVPSSPHTVLVTGEVNNPGLLSYIEGNSVTSYISRAGGLTDSSNYAVLIKPSGESQRVNFGFLRDNPDVPEGSTISVTKVPPPRPDESHVDIGGTIKDTFAILTSAGTLIYLIYQVSK